jgi:hypothetical protein
MPVALSGPELILVIAWSPHHHIQIKYPVPPNQLLAYAPPQWVGGKVGTYHHCTHHYLLASKMLHDSLWRISYFMTLFVSMSRARCGSSLLISHYCPMHSFAGVCSTNLEVLIFAISALIVICHVRRFCLQHFKNAKLHLASG